MTHSVKLDTDAETDVRAIKPERLVKWGVTKLREDVARKLKRRELRCEEGLAPKKI